ncbi:MAG: hypothetical protein E7277_03710 [Lachnospiraceae bacterium]|jgi:hypothetical protein|nr:hypothetical protein [Lachnospiraceae bacterium]
MNKAGMKKYLKYMVLLVICMVVMLPVMQVNAQKTTYSINVNRKQNVVIIYKKDVNGKYTVPIKAMVCSVGMQNRTPKGKFYISERYRWRQLFYGSYGQYATRICGNILFHSVGYDSRKPSTLQYKEYNKLGTSASHGCVRLSVEDAKWIYTHCKRGTQVVIYDSKKKEPLDKPEPIVIPTNTKLKNWDPTDTNAKNPWRKVAPKIQVKEEDLEVGVSTNEDLVNLASAVNYKGEKVKVTVEGNYDLTSIGSYEVTFVAVDKLGNKTEKTMKIRVGDTIAPVIVPIKQDSNIQMTVAQFKEMNTDGGELTPEEVTEWLKQYVSVMDNGKKLSKESITVSGVEDFFADYRKYLQDADFKFKERYNFGVSAFDNSGNKTKEMFLLILEMKDERFMPSGQVTM